MTELRKRMIESLQLRGISERTQEAYVRAVRQLAQHYKRSPDLISEEELRQYFLYIKNVKKYSRPTTTVALCGIKFFFERTLWGKSFEAVALNRRAAALMGINLTRVTAFSFAAGAGVAGLGGLLVAPNVSAQYLMGVPLAIQGFTALVIGGVGRVEGALLGGFLLAFAEQLTIRYAPIPGGYAQGVPLLFLIVFLLVRPSGLLKAKA